MNDIYHIDKVRVRASFDKAASTYDAAAILQKEVRARMLSRLDLVKITPSLIVGAGCGTGHASLALGKKYTQSRIVAFDIALNMLKKTRSSQPWLQRVLGSNTVNAVCGDIEQLPFAQGSASLIWSNLAMQWCNDLDQAFGETYRVLEPGGLLMFSTFGPDTLKELRESAKADPDHVHVSRFIDMHDIGDALVRAGYTAPVLDVERFTLTYDDVIGVMRDLKAIGATNAASGRRRGLEGKGFLRHLTANYEQYRNAGKLPATYEVVYGHAWKPEQNKRMPNPDGSIPVTLHKRK